MKIMTWNVDWFRNGKHSGGRDEVYLKKDIQDNEKQQIENRVQAFLQADDAIVFLQEIPDFRICSMNIAEGYESLCIKENAYNHTVAIAKENEWEDITSSFFEKTNHYKNRIVVAKGKRDNIIIVGVHIKDLRRQEKESDKKAVKDLWLRLIEFCKKYNPVAICGDFNTDSEYDEYGKKIPQFTLMEELKGLGYIEAQGEATRNKPGDKPTFKKTSHVDYVLVKKDIKTNKYIMEDLNLSDHLPLVADIEI